MSDPLVFKTAADGWGGTLFTVVFDASAPEKPWPYGEWRAEVGWYYAICNCRDFDIHRIEDAAELESLREEFEDDKADNFQGNWWHFWPTEAEALADPFFVD